MAVARQSTRQTVAPTRRVLSPLARLRGDIRRWSHASGPLDHSPSRRLTARLWALKTASYGDGYANARTGGSVETTIDDMIGASPAIKAIRAELEDAARSDAKVLLTGESGVGKDLAAQLIHQRSA